MAVVKWSFYDPSTLATEAFAVNPVEGGTPARKKTLTYRSTAAPDGKTLIYEGREEPQQFNFSGTLLTEDEYNMFITWFEKPRQVKVTDDLGREFWIFITGFTATRKRAVQHPFKHEYQVEATVLDWVT